MKDFEIIIGADLREKPVNESLFKQGIINLESSISDIQNSAEKAKTLSKIGVLYRISGALEKSMDRLNEAKTILKSLVNKDLSIRNQIRIAQTLQFQGHYTEADNLYEELIPAIKADSSILELLDFAYQHKAKNLFEMGQFDKALQSVQIAIELRKKKGNKELIKSSRFAYERIKEAMDS